MAIDFANFGGAPQPGDTLGAAAKERPAFGVLGATVPQQSGMFGNVPQGGSTDNQPAFEMVFGFLPTLNVGNILGIDNDIARTAVNILADPFAWLPAMFSGGLTIAGRASMAAARLNSTKNLLSMVGKASTTVRTLQQSIKTIDKAKKAANVAAHTMAAPKELLEVAKKAAQTGDHKTYVKAMRKIMKSDLPDDIKKGLNVSLDDLGNFKDLARLEEKLRKQANFRSMGKADADKAIASILDEKFLAADRVSQLAEGQRSILRIKLPFSSADGKTLIHGGGLYRALDNILPLDLKVIGGGSTTALFGASLLDKGDEVLKANKLTDEAIDLWKAEIQAANPGALDDMDSLMKFHIEGKGVPVEELKKLGMWDESMDKLAKVVSTKTTTRGEITGRVSNISVLPAREFDKFLTTKGWKKSMDSTKAHVGEHLEKLRKTAEESGMINDINRLENYIHHMWEIPEKMVRAEAKRLKTSGSMLNKRKFETYVEGMNNKFVPKQTSTFEVVRAYQREITEVIANRKIVNRLRSKANSVWVDGHKVKLFSTASEINKLSDAGVNTAGIFVNIVQEGSEAIAFLRKIGVVSKNTKDPLKAIYVPKRIAQSLKVLYKSKSTAQASKAIDGFNAMSKLASLSFSLFHAGALTETAVATMGGKGLVEAGKRGFGIPILSQILKKTGIAKDTAKHIADDAIAHGLIPGAASDAQIGMLNTMFDGATARLDKIMPGLGNLGRGGKKFMQVMNQALWDNFHEPMKFLNYEHQLAKLKKTKGMSHLSETELKRAAASLTNDAFGGQNWALLGVNPKFKQMLHWAMLAPDWTISNARIAGVGTTGLKGLARGVVGAARNPSEAMVGAYWRTAIPVMYGTMTLMNRSLTGKWMHENPAGHELDVALGTFDEKGRPEFMKLGKQMREPFRWLTEPLSIGGGKTSPFAKEVVEQLSGHSPGGGFPTAFANDFHKKPTTFVEQIPSRVANTLAKFVPFSLNGKSVFLAFPKKSLTPFGVEKALIESLERGKIKELLRATGLKSKKATEIRTILNIARSAGFNVNRILGNVKRKMGDEANILASF